MPKTVHLHTPISEADIRNLWLDDVVYITGDACTMLYDDHFTLIMDMIKAGKPLPMQMQDSVIYHTGVLYRKKPGGEYDYRAVGATTSSKYNALTPEFIRLTGIRAIIGKGGMDDASLDAMREYGCAYLTVVGGCSAFYGPFAEVETDFWPELTSLDNQRLKLRLKKFGPLFVGMDTRGNSIFQKNAKLTKSRLAEIYKKLKINTD